MYGQTFELSPLIILSRVAACLFSYYFFSNYAVIKIILNIKFTLVLVETHYLKRIFLIYDSIINFIAFHLLQGTVGVRALKGNDVVIFDQYLQDKTRRDVILLIVMCDYRCRTVRGILIVKKRVKEVSVLQRNVSEAKNLK